MRLVVMSNVWSLNNNSSNAYHFGLSNRLDNTLNSYLGFEVSRSQLLSMLQVLRDTAQSSQTLLRTA